MTNLRVHFDDELWRWELQTDRTIGPGGTATAALGDSVRIETDALDPGVVTVTIDAEGPSGALSANALETYNKIILGDLAEGGVVELPDDHSQILGRLAILSDEAERQRALGPISDKWEVEDSVLRSQLGLSEPAGLLAEGLLAEPDPSELSSAQAAFRSIPVDLGQLTEDGPIVIDPSWMASGLLDLRRLHCEVDPGPVVMITSGVQQGLYGAEISTIKALLIEAASDLMVGVAQFELDMVDRGVGAVARIAVGPGRRLDSLALVLASDLTRLPSGRLRTARAAGHLARRSAQAARLGLMDEATRLLRRSVDRWESIGRSFDASGQSLVMAGQPFMGELEDLALSR